MADKTLFLGNGLNRTIDKSLSWSEMMLKLGAYEPEGANIPFPIEFEQIAAKRGFMIGKKGKDPNKELREEIKDTISDFELPADAVHYRFASLNATHVVTTNFDRLFENCYANLDKCIRNPGSSRNILEAIYCLRDVDFYHAHGIDEYSNTLCLGHEHYISLVGKIQSALYPKGEEEQSIIENLIKGQTPSLSIWPEYLFTNDVAIVGFGMDYSEIDIWWLLALRASVFSPHNKMDEYENSITLYKAYDSEEKSKSPYEVSHSNALEHFGVNVVSVVKSSYKDAYYEIAEMVEKEWK